METSTPTQTATENIYPLQITGISASLHSYTLKEKYFDNETISGKSEINNGSSDIENGTLLAEIIKIEDNKPIEKINDWVRCITTDHQKRLWAGTSSGVAMFDGNNWQSYTQLSDGSLIGSVQNIDAGPDDKIYALTYNQIVVIDENNPQQQVYTIPFYSSYHDMHLDFLAVDKLSRLWMIYVYYSDYIIYDAVYYDETGWHQYEEGAGYAKTMLNDN